MLLKQRRNWITLVQFLHCYKENRTFALCRFSSSVYFVCSFYLLLLLLLSMSLFLFAFFLALFLLGALQPIFIFSTAKILAASMSFWFCAFLTLLFLLLSLFSYIYNKHKNKPSKKVFWAQVFSTPVPSPLALAFRM